MIHSTAIVDPSAEIAETAEIGPYCIIEADVTIGAGTIVDAHVVIKGPTVIGENNHIHSFASIGDLPQDLGFDPNSRTQLIIGDRNSIREYVSIHRAIVADECITRIGNDNMLMAHVHIGHNCILGNNIVIVNSANLAGHVEVGDWAILSGFTGFHQFCKVGAHAFVGIQSKVTQDILPFVMYAESSPKTINAKGLQRRGFEKSEIQDIRQAFKAVYRNGLSKEDFVKVLEDKAKSSPSVKLMLDFINQSNRGIAR
jgi:UDP-N-acetylglucosamine acyltransferase